jgi:hypothetical protein
LNILILTILFYHPYVFYNIHMRRFLIMIFILFLSVVCWGTTFVINQPTTALPTPSLTPAETAIPSLPTATITPSPSPSPQVVVPTSTNTTTPHPSSDTFTVLYHPDDMLYVGDQVSIEVVSPPGVNVKESNLQVQVDPPNGPNLGPVNFAAWGIQGRDQATLLWSWDTHDQDPGPHTLAFSIQPQGYAWTEQVTLLPSSDMPPDQAGASWTSTQTQCCTVFYITNTASERDISTLTSMIDEQARLSIDEMGSDFTQPITVTILPRLLGHGGFSSDEISVSYLDRNYAANSWEMVVHHEMIHDIDGKLGGDFRPTILVEGLAVYMAGGHYKLEPLMPRTAALLEGYLNWYIPLKTLADDFYASQHEIGYMEGASLVEYLVKTYGWDAFSAFYRDIHINQGESQSDAINAALKVHFSTSFDQLEQDFLASLGQESDTSAWVDDVRLTVTYYDSLRRYQQLLDPSAYFRTAWLLDNKTMRERGIVADYLRHPHTPQNLALETFFITANNQVSAQQFTDASQTLDVINLVLDGIEQALPDPFSISEISADYLSISSTLQQQGYEVQSIHINESTATVYVTNSNGPDLIELHLTRSGNEWLTIP